MVKKERRRNDVKTEPFSHDFCIFPNCFSNKCSTFITKSTNLLQIKNCFWFSVKNIKVQFRHLNTIFVAFRSKSVVITIAIPVSFIAKKRWNHRIVFLFIKLCCVLWKKDTFQRNSYGGQVNKSQLQSLSDIKVFQHHQTYFKIQCISWFFSARQQEK